MLQIPQQLPLFDNGVYSTLTFAKGVGTAASNRVERVHRWFPYVEGYSHDLVTSILAAQSQQPALIYDPFGGSGTTLLVASELGIASAYSEINPFMCFVAECKVNLARSLADETAATSIRTTLIAFTEHLKTQKFTTACDKADLCAFRTAFSSRPYFDESILRQVLAAKSWLDEQQQPARDLALLALAAILVPASNLIRRADLRYRTATELQQRTDDIRPVLAAKLTEIVDDLSSRRSQKLAATVLNDADARVCSDNLRGKADLVITSPPYLNGTNYFRNTKLELWLCGYLQSEDDLKGFRTAAITAGINNVSSRIPSPRRFEEVEHCATSLDKVAYDVRIPTLVRAYFSDMHQAFLAIRQSLQPQGRVYLDIGDSVFCGVHVPTDVLLVAVAAEAGLELVAKHPLRKRHSNNGAALTQVVLEFKQVHNQAAKDRSVSSDIY